MLFYCSAVQSEQSEVQNLYVQLLSFMLKIKSKATSLVYSPEANDSLSSVSDWKKNGEKMSSTTFLNHVTEGFTDVQMHHMFLPLHSVNLALCT